MENITMETVLLIKGVKVPMETFKTKYSLSDDSQAIRMAGLMAKQGKISIVENNTEEEDEIAKAIKENLAIEIADEIESQEDLAEVIAREDDIKDMELMEIELDFANTIEAQKFEAWCYDNQIRETCVLNRRGAITLEIKDITALEYANVAKKYKNERLVKSVVKGTDRGVRVATDTVNKVATDVIAPTATIVGKGAMNITKGLAQTLIKTGTGLFNSGAQAIKETKVELDTDVEMIKAKRELREAKDGLFSWGRKKLDKRGRTGGTGIKIK